MAGIGFTLTIKPLFLPLAIALLAIAAVYRRQNGLEAARFLCWSLVGLSAGPLLVFMYLWSMGSWGDFMRTLTTLIPLHAELGRRPFFYLVTHALSAIE